MGTPLQGAGLNATAGYSHRNQGWRLHNADGAHEEASGIHGQMVHVNPAATQALTLKAWSALAQAVRR